MRKIIFVLAAFAACVSCTKEPIADNIALEEGQTITFEASLSTGSDVEDTKTTLVDGSLVNWSNSDQVKVGFFPVTGSSKNTINNKNGIFTATFQEETASSAWFKMSNWTWNSGNSENASHYRTDGLAVYPTSAVVSSSRSGSYAAAKTEVSYTLTDEQTALLNSFQSGVNFSYAKVNKDQFSSNNASLSFKNACSLLKITLPSTANNVAMVEVKSNSGAPLTGKFSLSYDALGGYYQDQPQYDSNGILNFTAISGKDNVLLTAGPGKTLQAGGSYYIVVWPGTHSSGLSFTFTSSDGATCEKSVSQSVTFDRAAVESFNFKSNIDFVKEPNLELNISTLSLNANNGSASFTITTNYDWAAIANVDWLTFSPHYGPASIMGTTVTITANNNTDYTSSRTGVITISAGGLTKTITVTQAAAVKPQYSYLSTLWYAGEMSNGQMYVIRRCQNKTSPTNNYNVWSIDSSNKLKVVYNPNVNNTSGSAINMEEVFIFEKYSSTANLTDNNYRSHCAGYLKSVATGKYLKADMTFTAESKSDAQILSFANRYGSDTTADIDICLNGTNKTLYCGSDNYMSLNSINTPAQDTRKWIFQSVYRIN